MFYRVYHTPLGQLYNNANCTRDSIFLAEIFISNYSNYFRNFVFTKRPVTILKIEIFAGVNSRQWTQFKQTSWVNFTIEKDG